MGCGSPAGSLLTDSHLYWASREEGTIGRANLDGSGVVRSWIATRSFNLGGVAVDPRPSPVPLPLPSRPVTFGKVRHDRRAGTLVLDVWVPERGDLVLRAPRLGWKVLKGPEPPSWRVARFAGA